MYILGLNAYHGDAAAAIFKGDQLIAATEEERIRRVKHWAGLPVEAVRFCLEEAGIRGEELDVITVSRDPMAKMGSKLWYLAKKGLVTKQLGSRISNSFSIRNLKVNLALELGINPNTWRAQVRYVEHHRSHLASAFMVSPFEESALLSVDGMGDFTSTMRAVGRGNRIEVLDSVSYPHSLGILYTAFTQYLGFPNYGDEYKVMGLASYGRPVYLDQLRECVHLLPNGLFRLNPIFFRHFKAGVAMGWKQGTPVVGPLYEDIMEKRFGPMRGKGQPVEDFHRDMAASVQALCEEVIFYMAADLQRKTGLSNLCLAGGVSQNSVANGKLTSQTAFERLFIPPAAHDAGTAMGSALYWYHHEQNYPRQSTKAVAYTGSQFSDAAIIAAVDAAGCDYRLCDTEEMIAWVAEKLVSGAVVGWFQGRSEFGPRALGNRSILVDPRRADAQNLLNLKIKRRESFRPFAPSILAEAVATYFESSDEVPFMEKVFSIRPEKRHLIPAVTHVDGTGRLQTVREADNPLYHRLISRFAELSGVPILLNTSFNENEPIVNSPEDAIACYLRTQMDILVMGHVIVSR